MSHHHDMLNANDVKLNEASIERVWQEVREFVLSEVPDHARAIEDAFNTAKKSGVRKPLLMKTITEIIGDGHDALKEAIGEAINTAVLGQTGAAKHAKHH